ncbi:Ig-like domain-containing protein [uncultured Roseibium sp.]|uniref:Ig-like domain-containing protein n=1 Tax=uncultured Roseibium sp. TaxID=1936171 RepID=UPI00261E03C7|nr:Ig-like domain-containing protein [uncultured Roseibium sp.]
MDGLTFTGTAGDDTILGSNQSYVLNGEGGDDTITDGAGFSTINGGTGDDNMSGGSGLDVYVFNPGFGKDTISESTGLNGGIIRFGVGIDPSDVRYERFSGNSRDLLVVVGADSIRIDGFYNSTSTSASNNQLIQRIEFDNGETIDMTGALPFVGTSANDSIVGTSLEETITGLAGDDDLNGGSGLDIYVFAPGFGNDTINELSGASGGIIRFEGGILPEDIRFERFSGDRRDLLIVVGNDTIRVDAFYSSTLNSASNNQLIQRIEFESGDTIDMTGALPFVGTGASDTILGTVLADTITGLAGDDDLSGGADLDVYVFAPGFGNDTINELSGASGGIIRFEGGILPEDIRFERFSGDRRDLLIVVGNDTIRVDAFYSSTLNSASNNQLIQRIEFESGDTIDMTGGLPFVGTGENDTILGTVLADTITGLAGDDDLSGGADLDVYVFTPGFGNDTINELSGVNGGVIRFGGGILPEDIRFERFSGDRRDLLIVVGNDTIRVDAFYSSTSNSAFNNQLIQRIEFDNGDTIDMTGALPFVGTSQGETILGTALADTITGLAGDDDLSGGADLDVYVFTPGFGNDTINELSGVNGGVIRFGGGILPEDIRFERFSGDRRDLLIVVGNDTIRIDAFYNSTSNSASNNQLIHRIEFDNGDTIDMTGALPFVGTGASDTILGTALADTITGLAGDDDLSGGADLDVYVFAPGFGNDTINELSGVNGGVIRFEGGLTADDLLFFRPSNDTRDLLIQAGSDSVRVESFFNSAGQPLGLIDLVEFENGQQLSLASLVVSDTGELLNRPPNATNDAATIGLDEDATINLLGNDSDPNGDTLQITAVADTPFVPDTEILLPSGSTVSISASGQATFTPGQSLIDGLSPGQTVTDTFNYQIGDGRGGFDFATVSVTIEAPDPVELSLDISPDLAPGEVGTAQLEVSVNGSGGLSAFSVASVVAPQAYLVAVTADKGLVADGLSGSFSDTAFVLARGINEGQTGTIDVDIKGTAGPRSTLEATAQLADTAAITDIAARTTALQPSFVEAPVVSRIEDNLVARFGETIGTLSNALASHATQFETFGLNATSATAALAFAIEAAGDYGSIAERGQIGSLGQGWSTVADIGLAIDGTTVQLKGLTEIAALRSLSVDAAALYTVSASAGRSVALSGETLALTAPVRPVFEQGIDGRFSTSGAFEGTLVKTADGYRLDLDDGNALLFDSDGIFLRMEMSDSRQIVANHDGDMRIMGLSGPNGATLDFSRDTNGRLDKIEDADGRTTTFSYDGDVRLAAVSRPEGQSSFEYTSDGDLSKATAPGDILSAFSYDSFARLDGATYGNGAQSEDFAYDDKGGLTITDGAGRITQLDLLPGTVVGRITDGAGGASEILYDDDGNISGVRAPDGTETGFEFDDQGRLTKITDANGAALGFTYGENGEEPTSFTDAGGNTRSFEYDSGGRITKASWPDGTTLQFAYDADGNLTGYANRRGDDVTYTYDARGRLLSESDSSAGPTSYTYDTRGRLTSATNDQGTTSLGYDSADRVTQIDYPTGKSLIYTYNEAGLRASMSDGGDYNVFYEYDALGRLTGLRDEDSQIVTYEYDGAGNLVKETNGNGTVSEFTYDAAGRLTRIENQAPDDSINSFNEYTYDAAGQRVTNTTQDGSWTYGYDTIGQLTSAEFISTNQEIADKSLTYEYDAAGNRTKVVEDGVETLYSANALNQYTRVGDATFSYDADGNMTSRTDGNGTTTYTYDLDNRLTSVTEADGTLLEFAYDVFGNRVAKTVDGTETEYLVDPSGSGTTVVQYTDGARANSYYYGLDLLGSEISNEISWFDLDGIGSTVTLTSNSGSVQNSYSYDPFGKEHFKLENVSNEYGFSGGLGVTKDSESVLYMRSRSTDVSLGRFLTEDPLFVSGDVENLYRFAANQPMNLVDPDGEFWNFVAQAGIWIIRVGGGALTANSVKNVARDAIVKEAVKADHRLTEEQRESLIDELNKDITKELVMTAGPSILYKGPMKLAPKGMPNQQGAEAALDGVWIGTTTGLPALENLKNPNNEGAEPPDLDPSSPFSPPIPPRKPNPDVPIPDRKPVFDVPTPPKKPAFLGGAPSAGSDGDPHIRTFDGAGYSFQAVGEFILFRTKDGVSEFQVRQEPWRDSTTVSVNTAITARFGDDVLGIYAGETIPLAVNGTAVFLQAGDSISVGTGSVYFDGRAYTITDAFGNGVWARPSSSSPFMNLRPFASNDLRGDVEGLLGNADGDRSNDFTLRDGTVLSQPLATTVLYGEFADAWRVDQANSLFVYGDGESTETFTDRDFPNAVITLDDLDPGIREDAEAAAIAAGLIPGTFEFETTVLDIALTGVDEFADFVEDAPEFQPDGEEIEIIPVEINEAPIANPDSAEVAEDGTVVIDVLANDTDPEGDPLEILGAGDVNGGTVDILNQQIVFTPAPGFNGDTVISYQLGDGAGNAVLGSVAVEVGAVPDAPNAVDDSGAGYATDEDTRFFIGDFLANDSDEDGDPITLVSVNTDGLLGTLIDSGNGTYEYVPGDAFHPLAAGSFATDSFTYRIGDGTGLFAEATVTISITGLNDGPTLNSDEGTGFSTDEDSAFTTANVLDNDSDVDGDTLTVSGLDTSGTLGLVTDNGDGTFDYDPNGAFESLVAGEAATDSFVYTVSDGNGGSSTGSVTISIAGADDAPDLNPVYGTDGSDYLVGTDADDAIRSFAGQYDRMRGGEGADQFIFGDEASNGLRERDLIYDFEAGIDSIVFENGASLSSVRELTNLVILYLEGDSDAVFVRGDGVTAANVTIVDSFEFV